MAAVSRLLGCAIEEARAADQQWLIVRGLPASFSVPGQEWLDAAPTSRAIIHSREYDSPSEFEGKSVLVVGGRSSGVDIARRCASRCAPQSLLLYGHSMGASAMLHLAAQPGNAPGALLLVGTRTQNAESQPGSTPLHGADGALDKRDYYCSSCGKYKCIKFGK